MRSSQSGIICGVDGNKQLADRLTNIWDPPNFTAFFKKYATRAPLLIKKGNNIFYEGDQPDRIYFIKEGYVKLSHLSEEGKDTIIYLYGPGSVLGVRALTSRDQRLKHSAEVLTDVKIVTLPRQEYFRILTEHPEYLLDLLHIFIDRLNYTERKLEGFITTDTIARVASFLTECVRRFSALSLPLTHQRIAEFTGSARETVTVALHGLEKEGVLRMQRGKIVILNQKKLLDYVTLHRKS